MLFTWENVIQPHLFVPASKLFFGCFFSSLLNFSFSCSLATISAASHWIPHEEEEREITGNSPGCPLDLAEPPGLTALHRRQTTHTHSTTKSERNGAAGVCVCLYASYETCKAPPAVPNGSPFKTHDIFLKSIQLTPPPPKSIFLIQTLTSKCSRTYKTHYQIAQIHTHTQSCLLLSCVAV